MKTIRDLKTGGPYFVSAAIQLVPFVIAWMFPSDFRDEKVFSAIPFLRFLECSVPASLAAGAVVGALRVKTLADLPKALVPVGLFGALAVVSLPVSNTGVFMWFLVVITQSPIIILGASLGAFLSKRFSRGA